MVQGGARLNKSAQMDKVFEYFLDCDIYDSCDTTADTIIPQNIQVSMH